MPLLGTHLESLYSPSLWTVKPTPRMTHAKPLIGYLGPEGSYCQQAALQRFRPEGYSLVPQTSIQDVFKAVQSGSVPQGVVPFENSTFGSVVETLDLFADAQNAYPDICVTEETILDVHHCLVGRAAYGNPATSYPSEANHDHNNDPALDDPPTKPIHSLTHVKHIYSHPQGFGQCEKFLQTYLAGVQRHETTSTSRAAAIAARDPTSASVAICSERAGRKFGLDVLGRGIQNSKDNATRFFVLRKAEQGLVERDDESIGHRSKTLVSFTVDPRRPGALVEALMVFQAYGLNLTSINSRPIDTQRWDYIFFIEFQGSRFADPQGRVKGALADLQKVTRSSRWLGSWVDQQRKRGSRSPSPNGA